MNFTKTDYILYGHCKKCLWIKKKKPELYPELEVDEFLNKLAKEGYEVEALAQELFPDAMNLGDSNTTDGTLEALKINKTLFQASFKTDKGVYARIDMLEANEDGTYNIYEVKSSTKIKRAKEHNHLKDIAFQKYVLEELGYVISKASIIHLNPEYIKNGELDYSELFIIRDVLEDIGGMHKVVQKEIEDALEMLQKEDIDMEGCECSTNTRNHRCDCFELFNPDIDKNWIYNIKGLRKQGLKNLIDLGYEKIEEVINLNGLNDTQKKQIISHGSKEAVIDLPWLKNWFKQVEYPLHFIDYEGYSSAIPKLDGTSPHRQFAFQVSVHTMKKDGSLSHFEYLSDKLVLPKELIQKTKEFTGLTGKFVSWNKGYEKGMNKKISKLFAQHKIYLDYMNQNMIDLEDPFKNAYIDYRFNGSSSIKNVLPVLVPDLDYKTLDVQNGTMAVEAWEKMINTADSKEKEAIRKNLLKYCFLDTFAMVAIFLKLKKLT